MRTDACARCRYRSTDAFFLERAEGNPYANVRATTQALAHDPHIERLSVPLQLESVAGFIRERDRGSVIQGPPASSASAGGQIIR
ncbi:hypothetical protein [Methylobacterium sp. WL116]|uniref:hypothetical protein n=1 Tax=Methylobacterium sp. WL116 TaxID=2603889 RepID=UPI0011C729AA|nr:hypothetical protein [Methylobacterium sp. WL116]TXM93709.1 hypothetical protein FV223_07475 [Methylobacterium sp. WL116]